MLNKTYLIGILGNAPEIRTLQDGRGVATLSLATNSSWKDKQGNWRQHTDWHRVSVFQDFYVSWIKNSVKKGDTLLVEGKLSYSEWEDKFKNKRKVAHIVVYGREGRIHLMSSVKQRTLEKDSLRETPLRGNSLRESSLRDTPLREDSLRESCSLKERFPLKESSTLKEIAALKKLSLMEGCLKKGPLRVSPNRDSKNRAEKPGEYGLPPADFYSPLPFNPYEKNMDHEALHLSSIVPPCF